MKAPLGDGLTVATITPCPISEHDAEATMTTGWTGLANGRLMVPVKVMARPATVIAVVYIRRANLRTRLRWDPNIAA